MPLGQYLTGLLFYIPTTAAALGSMTSLTSGNSSTGASRRAAATTSARVSAEPDSVTGPGAATGM